LNLPESNGAAANASCGKRLTKMLSSWWSPNVQRAPEADISDPTAGSNAAILCDPHAKLVSQAKKLTPESMRL
jgi:hypothetical protein